MHAYYTFIHTYIRLVLQQYPESSYNFDKIERTVVYAMVFNT